MKAVTGTDASQSGRIPDPGWFQEELGDTLILAEETILFPTEHITKQFRKGDFLKYVYFVILFWTGIFLFFYPRSVTNFGLTQERFLHLRQENFIFHPQHAGNINAIEFSLDTSDYLIPRHSPVFSKLFI